VLRAQTRWSSLAVTCLVISPLFTLQPAINLRVLRRSRKAVLLSDGGHGRPSCLPLSCVRSDCHCGPQKDIECLVPHIAVKGPVFVGFVAPIAIFLNLLSNGRFLFASYCTSGPLYTIDPSSVSSRVTLYLLPGTSYTDPTLRKYSFEDYTGW